MGVNVGYEVILSITTCQASVSSAILIEYNWTNLLWLNGPAPMVPSSQPWTQPATRATFKLNLSAHLRANVQHITSGSWIESLLLLLYLLLFLLLFVHGNRHCPHTEKGRPEMSTNHSIPFALVFMFISLKRRNWKHLKVRKERKRERKKERRKEKDAGAG